MLATKLTKPPRFPLLATPKLDGIRCYVADGEARTRSGARLPNLFAREWIERNCPNGFDGELICGTFSETSAAMMRSGGEPDFIFHVFDYVFDDLAEPYAARIEELSRLRFEDADERARFVLPEEIGDRHELAAFCAKCIAAGFEGAVLRDPAGEYECGKADEAGGAMLKWKPTDDGEARITGINLRPDGTLHSLDVERDGVAFALGNGISDKRRIALPAEDLIGKLVKYRHKAGDVKREPVFLGFRDARDLTRAA